MDVRKVSTTVAAAAVAALLIACGGTKSSPPQTRPEPQNPEPVPATTATKGPPPKTTGTTKMGTLAVRSTAQTKTRVSCSNIQTEERLTASTGPVNWTARAVDQVSNTGAGNVIGSITASPSSGSLADGASTVVRIGGSYPGGTRFVVVFEYPTSVGSGRVNVEMSC
jgi:hypothetical protein